MSTSKNKKVLICFTGGGTAGHIMPNLSIISSLDPEKWQCFYVGSKDIEERLVKAREIEFKKVSSGKLRRYLSFENFVDFFRVLWGFLQSLGVFIVKRPAVVFSKGGFVSVPVCYAAFFLRIPVITHESDLTPGLANRLISKIAFKILYTFPETKKYLPANKSLLVGSLVRPELLTGSDQKGLDFLGLNTKDRRILLVMGGSLGSEQLNNLIFDNLQELTQAFTVVHITGNSSLSPIESNFYHSYSYIDKELPDLLACVDLVVSRAGANAIFEFLALHIPMLLLPLRVGSRGDQVDNALNFAKKGFAKVIEQKHVDSDIFMQAIKGFKEEAPKIKSSMMNAGPMDSLDKVHALLCEAL